MGSFTYCHKCGEGQGAPTIDDFAYSGLNCQSCGVKREVDGDWFAMAVADMRDGLDERLQALEAKSHTPVDFSPILDRLLTLEEAALHVLNSRNLTLEEALDLENRLMAREEPRFNPDFMASQSTPDAATMALLCEGPGRVVRTPKVPERGASLVTWFAVEDVAPPEREFLMVTGPSGYTTTPSYLAIAQAIPRHRLSEGMVLHWQDEANSALTDRYELPTHWARRINLPGDAR